MRYALERQCNPLLRLSGALPGTPIAVITLWRARDEASPDVMYSIWFGASTKLAAGRQTANATNNLRSWGSQLLCFATLLLSSETRDWPPGVGFTALLRTMSRAPTDCP